METLVMEEKKKTGKTDLCFITEIIQRGRIRPAKYIHTLVIPSFIYDELILHGIVKPEDYYIHETAFFEFRYEKVLISFACRGLCDALQFAIDKYLITELMGKYPIERTGQSKMNFDKKQFDHITMLDTDGKRKLIKGMKENFKECK